MFAALMLRGFAIRFRQRINVCHKTGPLAQEEEGMEDDEA